MIVKASTAVVRAPGREGVCTSHSGSSMMRKAFAGKVMPEGDSMETVREEGWRHGKHRSF